jgi:hypothetical protein
VISDDIYRYVWEGHVQNLGYNPFSTPPAHPDFKGDPLIEKINFPEIPAVYPPVAQILFKLLALIQPSLYLFKAVFILFSFFTLAFLLLKRKDFPGAFPVFALLPLVVIEFAWSGHFDIVGICFFIFAVSALKKDQGFKSGIFLALAIGIKYLPIIAIPFFIKTFSHKERKKFLLSLLLIPLFYFPYMSAGKMLFFALTNYSKTWAFNGFLFKAIANIFNIPQLTTRFILLFLFLVCYFDIIRRVKDPLDNIFLTLFCVTVFSPIVWPWYLLWLLPFGIKSFPRTTIIYLTLSFYAYEIMEPYIKQGLWEQSNLVLCIEYFSTFAVFIYELRKYIKQLKLA